MALRYVRRVGCDSIVIPVSNNCCATVALLLGEEAQKGRGNKVEVREHLDERCGSNMRWPLSLSKFSNVIGQSCDFSCSNASVLR